MTEFARILLLPDGTTHIALKNRQTFQCSANAVYSLLNDPVAFESENCLKFLNSTRILNKRGYSLGDIPGLTLAEVSSSGEMLCNYTLLMRMVVDAFVSGSAQEPLTLESLLNTTSFKDMKELCLNFFMRNTTALTSDIEVANKEAPPSDILNRLLAEAVSFTSPRKTGNKPQNDCDVAPKDTRDSGEDTPEHGIPENFVSFSRYCEMNKVNPSTARQWLYANKLRTAVKSSTGRIYIDPSDVPEDRRKGRVVSVKGENNKKYVTLKGRSYEAVQEYIAGRKLVTDKIRPFIRTIEEIRYYEKHRYHEVEWNGKAALIIDINPSYFCEREQMTNRQLIEAGRAPVVTNNDNFCYHLHHIGQKKTSPFAIIPEFDHNGKESSQIFHQGASELEDIHFATYDMQKRSFWKTYLEMYDAYNGYTKIPYRNSRHKKHER